MIDHLGVIADESERFVAALAGCDAAATVPAAPDWSADDLLWHLAEVQWFWAAVVAGRLDDPDAAEAAAPSRPTARTELLALCRSGTQALLDALGGVDAGEPVWTWSDDRTVGFVRRRQVHEVVIHRVDAEQTAGSPVTPVGPDVAADGIDEVLTEFLSGTPPWMTFVADGATVAIETSGGARRWSFSFGRASGTSPDSGASYDLAALEPGDVAAPDATITGTEHDLLLWLWGRGDRRALAVSGDVAVADRVREVMADATR